MNNELFLCKREPLSVTTMSNCVLDSIAINHNISSQFEESNFDRLQLPVDFDILFKKKTY